MADKIDVDKYVDTKEMVNNAKSMTRYGKIIDLNNNVVMTEEDYNRLYQPEIISVVTFEEYKQKCEEIKTKTTSTLMPLLEIAAYKEYTGEVR